MFRYKIIRTFFLALPILIVFECALPAEKIILIMKSRKSVPYDLVVQGFKKELTSAGVPHRIVEQSRKVPENVDLVLTIGSKSTQEAIKQFKKIPIVFSMVLNLKNKHYQAKNLTGISLNIPSKSKFRMLQSILPDAKIIGVLYNPDSVKSIVDEGVATAQSLGMTVLKQEVHSKEDMYSAVRSLTEKIDVLWMVSDPTIYTLRAIEDILLHTLRKKIPVIGLSTSYTKAGALFSLSSNYKDVGKQAGETAIKILGGQKPETIPTVHPREWSLSINLIAGDRIGIKVLDHVVQKADNVFE